MNRPKGFIWVGGTVDMVHLVERLDELGITTNDDLERVLQALGVKTADDLRRLQALAPSDLHVEAVEAIMACEDNITNVVKFPVRAASVGPRSELFWLRQISAKMRELQGLYTAALAAKLLGDLQAVAFLQAHAFLGDLDKRRPHKPRRKKTPA
jgi:hypothetical protein